MSESPRVLVEKLTVGGLKGFSEPTTLQLAPITLLFGPNSGGKSSILEALLLLKQTAEAPQAAGALVSRGSYVDLGPFAEFIHGHDLTRRLVIGLHIPLQGNVRSARQIQPLMSIEAYTCSLPFASAGWEWTFAWDARQRQVTLGEQGISLDGAPFVQLVPLPAYDTAWEWERTPTDVAETIMLPRLGNPDHPFWDAWLQRTTSFRDQWRRLVEERAREFDADRTDAIRRYIDEIGRNGPSGVMEAQAYLLERFDHWREYLEHYDVAAAQRDAFLTVLDLAAEANRMSVDIFWAMNDAAMKARTAVVNRESWGPNSELLPETYYPSEGAPVLVRFRGALVDAVSDQEEPRQSLRKDSYPLWLLDGESDLYGRPMPPVPAMGALAQDISRAMRGLLRDRLSWVGPYRDVMPAFTEGSSLASGRAGSGGAPLSTLLADDRARRDIVNNLLKRMGIPYQLDVTVVAEGSPEEMRFLRVVSAANGVPMRPSGVGHGVGQVLPVLAESSRTEPSVIVVEQPELHLHPRLQLALGTVLVDSMHERGHQYVIETHSEHLVLRLQREIRQGHLKPADVAVYYVKQGPAADASGQEDWVTTIHRLRLDAGGDFIDEWPDGFFEEAYREMFGEDPA